MLIVLLLAIPAALLAVAIATVPLFMTMRLHQEHRDRRIVERLEAMRST